MIKEYLINFDELIFNFPSKYFLKNIKVIEYDKFFEIQLYLDFFLNKNQSNNLVKILSNFLYKKIINKPFKFNIISDVLSHKVQPNLKLINNIKNIIAVTSGKGGVGKSTITSNLSICLQKMGAKVGILDADIYGPSQPYIMGNTGSPITNDRKKIQPLLCHGVKMISIGNLIDQNSAIIWRGPMVSSALMQLLNDTNWGELDYLFIDLPPGTGDIQLTMAKKIPLTSGIVVTTPQKLSLLDAKKSSFMLKKLDVHISGIIENMNIYNCYNCGASSKIFGEKAAEQLSNLFKIPILGQIPLDMKIRKDTDKGIPSTMNNDYIHAIYEKISLKFAINLAQLPKAIMINMPKTKIEY